MKSSSGNKIKYTLFGMSHSEEIGIEIVGFEKGLKVNFDEISYQLELRQGKKGYNTARQESPNYIIKSGFDGEVTNGEVIVVVFKNENFKSKDYSHLANQPRPGHADYVSMMKYGSTNVGGGHFSGRMTAPIVFLGMLCMQAIRKSFPTFKVISHISSFQNVNDISYYEIRKELVEGLSSYDKDSMLELRKLLHDRLCSFDNIVFDKVKRESIEELANKLVEDKTSAGGEIETLIINPPNCLGEPFFDSVEGIIAKLLYSIPSVKGVTFGYGTDFVNTQGHLVKDEIIYLDDNSLYTLYNYNGGINGGITNGEDIVFKTIIKPISSLLQKQFTYNIESKECMSLEVGGRHDVTIINRVIPVIDSVACIAIYELI